MIELLIHAVVLKATTTQVEGAFVQSAHCENCDCSFSYLISRPVELKRYRPVGPKATREFLLRREANRAIQFEFQNDCDPVPCPSCGWFQTDMIPRMRGVLGRVYQPRLRRICTFAICLGVIMAWTSPIAITEGVDNNEPLWTTLGILGIVVGLAISLPSIILIRRRNRALRQYYPNADGMWEERMAEGQRRQQEASEFLAASDT
jgi:hypothetical protein